MRWRFNWYRQITKDRILKLLVPDEIPPNIPFDIPRQLPDIAIMERPKQEYNFELFDLESLYNLVPGHYHNLSDLAPGNIPVISCGDANNGISGYYHVQNPLYKNKLTIAFNGMNTLTTKYHPYTFSAKDDVAICLPNREIRLTTELFIQVMLNRERWRYSYYRKCFINKLRHYQVFLPAKDWHIHEDIIQRITETTPYWNYIESCLNWSNRN